MNSELKELAKQSGISFGGHPMNPLSVYPSELQKFAKLIIDECSIIADEYADEHLRSLPSQRMRKLFEDE